MQADVHAAEDQQGAVGGGDPLGQEEEVETELDIDEEDEEEQEVEIDKDDPDFEDMIASGHIKMKV